MKFKRLPKVVCSPIVLTGEERLLPNIDLGNLARRTLAISKVRQRQKRSLKVYNKGIIDRFDN